MSAVGWFSNTMRVHTWPRGGLFQPGEGMMTVQSKICLPLLYRDKDFFYPPHRRRMTCVVTVPTRYFFVKNERNILIRQKIQQFMIVQGSFLAKASRRLVFESGLSSFLWCFAFHKSLAPRINLKRDENTHSDLRKRSRFYKLEYM